MKNLKIISAILLVSTFLGSINITNAYTVNNNQTIQKLKDYKEKQYLLKEYKKMQNMSIEELQNIITEAKINSENRNFIGDIVTSPAKLAWLAAAQIAKKSGYPLAAELVECSVIGINYFEYEGPFAKAIKNTSTYNKIKNNNNGSDIFTPEINKDLYYAIRLFSYTSDRTFITVKDTFDFRGQKDAESMFSLLVNNFAYLNQNISVLNPIDVEIVIKK